MFVLVKEPLITESELASLKHKLEKEKQNVEEIYKIAFEKFLEKNFTNKFLIDEIRKEMKIGNNHMKIRFVNHDILRNRSNLNFRCMIGDTFLNFFLWFFFDRTDIIKRRFKKYHKEVKGLVNPFRKEDVIQLSMEEIYEDVIYKSVSFQKIISDLEKSGIRAEGSIENEVFTLFLIWEDWSEENEEI
ncbi:hypothetical protein [Bacillus toyonensis]|uniref:hypothetical protein n=1 Tax=Bacillus toyonensis TaxID=155322 RepID=UPI0036E4F1E6